MDGWLATLFVARSMWADGLDSVHAAAMAGRNPSINHLQTWLTGGSPETNTDPPRL